MVMCMAFTKSEKEFPFSVRTKKITSAWMMASAHLGQRECLPNLRGSHGLPLHADPLASKRATAAQSDCLHADIAGSFFPIQRSPPMLGGAVASDWQHWARSNLLGGGSSHSQLPGFKDFKVSQLW